MRQTNGNSMNAPDRDFAMNNQLQDLVVQMMHTPVIASTCFVSVSILSETVCMSARTRGSREQPGQRMASLEINSMEFFSFCAEAIVVRNVRSCLMCEEVVAEN